jgi:hypothetical protein
VKRQGHTHAWRGRRVVVYRWRLPPVEGIKYKAHRARCLEFYDHPDIPTKDIRTVTLYRP